MWTNSVATTNITVLNFTILFRIIEKHLQVPLYKHCAVVDGKFSVFNSFHLSCSIFADAFHFDFYDFLVIGAFYLNHFDNHQQHRGQYQQQRHHISHQNLIYCTGETGWYDSQLEGYNNRSKRFYFIFKSLNLILWLLPQSILLWPADHWPYCFITFLRVGWMCGEGGGLI